MVQKLTSKEVHDKVRDRYAAISCSVKDRFKYPTGRSAALALGYELTDDMPQDAVDSFCGVGNPFTLGEIDPGDTVLDVGCGAGFDMLVASGKTGKEGRVCGIDLVPAMVHKARENLSAAGIAQTDVQCAGSELIPYDDNRFDVVISNASVYLSPLKEQTLLEIQRVLKPEALFLLSDIVLKDDIPDDVRRLFNGWSG